MGMKTDVAFPGHFLSLGYTEGAFPWPHIRPALTGLHEKRVWARPSAMFQSYPGFPAQGQASDEQVLASSSP